MFDLIEHSGNHNGPERSGLKGKGHVLEELCAYAVPEVFAQFSARQFRGSERGFSPIGDGDFSAGLSEVGKQVAMSVAEQQDGITCGSCREGLFGEAARALAGGAKEAIERRIRAFKDTTPHSSEDVERGLSK